MPKKNKQLTSGFPRIIQSKKLQGENELSRKEKSIQFILSRRRQVKSVKRLGLQPRTRQSGVHIPADFVAGGIANKIRELEKIALDFLIQY